jgi:cytochrome c oxidase subunit 2
MAQAVRSKLLFTVGALIALAVAAPAVAGNGGFAPVPPESPNAEGITQTWWIITAFILGIFVLVEGLLIAFVIRYRRRRRAREADGAQIHGSSRLETMWTLGPVVVLFVIAIAVFVKLPGISNVPQASAGSENLVVEVEGRQYYWLYRYPNGVVTIDTLRAPVGKTVELEVTAPDWDVIHSWWVPALAGKIDAIPGRVNSVWFQAERVGAYQGQCAELCGLNHAKMFTTVEVLPEDEFDRWLATRREEQTAGTSDLGEEQWNGVCAGCHGLDGQGGAAANAPGVAGSALLADTAAIDRLLENGGRTMPPVGRNWTDEQLTAMTDYLQERFGNQG